MSSTLYLYDRYEKSLSRKNKTSVRKEKTLIRMTRIMRATLSIHITLAKAQNNVDEAIPTNNYRS